MKKSLLAVLLIGMTIGVVLSCSKAGNDQKAISSGDAAKGDPGYTYKITLEKMQFNWRLDGDNLKIKLQAQTPGWVGIGFNPSEGMKDANFVMGSVDKGVATITHQYGVSKTMHKKNVDLGGENRVTQTSGSERDNATEITFSMPYKTADKLNKPINVKQDTTVLLAYGKSKLLMQVHVFMAKLKINLSTGKYSVLMSKK